MELNFESKQGIKDRRKALAATRRAAKQPSLFDNINKLTDKEFAEKYNGATKEEKRQQLKSFQKWLDDGHTDFDDPVHLNALVTKY